MGGSGTNGLKMRQNNENWQKPKNLKPKKLGPNLRENKTNNSMEMHKSSLNRFPNTLK